MFGLVNKKYETSDGVQGSYMGIYEIAIVSPTVASCFEFHGYMLRLNGKP